MFDFAYIKIRKIVRGHDSSVFMIQVTGKHTTHPMVEFNLSHVSNTRGKYI